MRLFLLQMNELAIDIDIKKVKLKRQHREASAIIDGWAELAIPEDFQFNSRA